MLSTRSSTIYVLLVCVFFKRKTCGWFRKDLCSNCFFMILINNKYRIGKIWILQRNYHHQVLCDIFSILSYYPCCPCFLCYLQGYVNKKKPPEYGTLNTLLYWYILSDKSKALCRSISKLFEKNKKNIRSI